MQIVNSFPETIYKYRDWNKVFHKNLLNENELYFANAEQFNDPYDCSIPFKYAEEDLTREKLNARFGERIRMRYPNMSESEVELKINAIPDEQYDFDRPEIKETAENIKRNLQKRFGIVSFSTEQDNLLMWGHYANSHTGFCVGFDSLLLANEIESKVGTGVHLRDVQYQEKLPRLRLEGEQDLEKIKKLFYTKFVDWKYESEYRLLLSNYSSKTLKISANAYKEIILGCNISDDHEAEIFSICKNKFPNIKIWKCITDENNFELTLKRVK